MEGIFRLPEEYKFPAMLLQRFRQITHTENRRNKSHANPIGSLRARIDQLTDIKRIARGRRHPPELSMPLIVAANLFDNYIKDFFRLQPMLQEIILTRGTPLRAAEVFSK